MRVGFRYMCMTGRQRKGQTRYMVGYRYRTGGREGTDLMLDACQKVLGDREQSDTNPRLCSLMCCYRIRPIKRTVRVEIGKIFCRRDVGNHLFYRTLNDCRSERISCYCTFALWLFSLLRRLPHVKRSIIGQ